MSRRQRIRRGVRHAPALPPEPAQRDLGGVGQRDLPRCAPGRTPEPEAVEAFFAELDAAAGADLRYDAAVDALRESFGELDEPGARRLAEQAAITLEASLLLRHAPAPVADAFIGSRIADPGLAYGAQAVEVSVDPVLERVLQA